MNTTIVNKRQSQVLCADVINSSVADFLATHVPFKKIVVKQELALGQKGNYISETDFYSKYFLDPNNYSSHQLIIVEGSSGTGKSHFIRWLGARLEADSNINDVILLIKKDDNTLRGAIRQLLELKEIKNISNKDAYERLVSANRVISDNQFKSQIVHQFLVEIETSSKNVNSNINALENRRLRALFSNETFANKVLYSTNGPIERILHKIVKQETFDADEIALFKKEDLYVTADLYTDMQSNGADLKAISLAGCLLEGSGDSEELAQRLVDYLNSLMDDVVQTCSGIQSGDFKDIIKEIRKELRGQGRNLILLIEDINSFTGVNKALLDALIIGHTGEYEKENMCRLISVVGTTSQFYSTFIDSYKDRITTQVTIEDNAISDDANTLCEFFAKYLNALNISKEDIENWYQNGADYGQLPVFIDLEHKTWDHFDLNGKQICLYPFTRKAIENLNANKEKIKTPRDMLTKIIKPAISDILTNKKMFLAFATDFARLCDENTYLEVLKASEMVQNLSIKEKERLRERTCAFIVIYQGSILDSKQNSPSYFINNEIWNEFGFENILPFLNKKTTDNESSDKDNKDDDKKPPEEQINKEYIKYANNVRDWFQHKSIFNQTRVFRESINSIIKESFNWEDYGISPMIYDNITKKSLIGFERQDRGFEESLIKLPADGNTMRLLIIIGKYIFLGGKSWDYKDSSGDLAFFTSWLFKMRDEMKNVFLQDEAKSRPSLFIKCLFSIKLFYILLTTKVESLDDLSLFDFIKDTEKTYSESEHTVEWKSLVSFLDSGSLNISLVTEYLRDHYVITQGNKKPNIISIAFKELESDFRFVKSASFETPDSANNYYGDKKAIVELCSNLTKKISNLVKKEKEQLEKKLDSILAIFENSDDIDILEPNDISLILNKFKGLYEMAEQSSYNIDKHDNYNLIKNLEEKNDLILKAIVDCKKVLKMDDDPIQSLCLLSNGCYAIVNQFATSIDYITKDINMIKNIVGIELGKYSGSNSNEDSRFKSEKEEFNNLFKEVKQ